ncbi:MAG: AbrB/MazE/SpoVT family DNA-binding domain-containing protein [Actinomycetota bacterium]|nr:AbrB/MazE/SpoVT family DNA-binding domain-containing protein [Actinomycetota bacterium]
MTPVVVRQRNQVTIPKAIAQEAGISEGTVVDLVYADGVITVTLPGHADRPFDLDRYRGAGKGVWGSTQDEIDRHLRDMRDEWDRESPA